MSDAEDVIQAQAASDDESEDAVPVVAAVVDEVENYESDASVVDDDVDNAEVEVEAETEAEADIDADIDADMDADESFPATPAKSIDDEEDDDEEDNQNEGDHELETPSRASASVSPAATPAPSTGKKRGPKPGKRKRRPSPKKLKTGIPSTKDLFVPFRAIKRVMKLDKDIGTVQNEAAMVATYAVEMFMEKMVNESHDKAKKRGRNTVKYEDLAEVRASHSNMSFLNTLIPWIRRGCKKADVRGFVK